MSYSGGPGLKPDSYLSLPPAKAGGSHRRGSHLVAPTVPLQTLFMKRVSAINAFLIAVPLKIAGGPYKDRAQSQGCWLSTIKRCLQKLCLRKLSYGPGAEGAAAVAGVIMQNAGNFLQQAHGRILSLDDRAGQPGHALRNVCRIIDQQDNRGKRLKDLCLDGDELSVGSTRTVIKNGDVNRLLCERVDALNVVRCQHFVAKGLEHQLADGQYLFAIAEAQKHLLVAPQMSEFLVIFNWEYHSQTSKS